MAAIDFSPFLGGIEVGTVVTAIIAVAGALAVVMVALVGSDRALAMISGDLAKDKKMQERYERSREWDGYRSMRKRADSDARNRSRDLAEWRSRR